MVIRDVTSHGGEAEVGCARQADVANREAFHPVIPSSVLGLDLKAWCVNAWTILSAYNAYTEQLVLDVRYPKLRRHVRTAEVRLRETSQKVMQQTMDTVHHTEQPPRLFF